MGRSFPSHMSDYEDGPKLVGAGLRRSDETDEEEKMDVEEGNSDKERNDKQARAPQDSDEVSSNWVYHHILLHVIISDASMLIRLLNPYFVGGAGRGWEA